MNVQFLNPFIEAAFAVLDTEIGVTAKRGQLSLQRSAATASEVTVLISLVGQVKGVVLYGLSEATALQFVSKILGESLAEFDNLAQSGISEMGNVITGQASQRLAEAGFESNISPPTMIVGKGTLISTLDFERLQVPLETDLGTLQIHLALRETKNGMVPHVASMGGV